MCIFVSSRFIERIDKSPRRPGNASPIDEDGLTETEHSLLQEEGDDSPLPLLGKPLAKVKTVQNCSPGTLNEATRIAV